MISLQQTKLSRFSRFFGGKSKPVAAVQPPKRRTGSWADTPFASGNRVTLCSKNGRSVLVRRVRRDDAPDLVYLVETMSDRSRYRRYHRPVSEEPPRWIWDEARELAQANRRQKGGLIALATLPTEGEVPVGTAYYVRASAGVAELAISLRDDFQGEGLGFQLLLLLAKEAWSAGIHTLTAYTQAENQAINFLIAKLPFVQRRLRSGADVEIEIYLDQPIEQNEPARSSAAKI